MKSKEHKIVFNLSIKDLKELGILDKKKKKKKRRKNKYSKKKMGKLQTGFPITGS